jgi:excisionase family DNA binding protein
MENDLPQILTIEEAAQYLRIPLSSLYKLAQEGRVPCQKVGRHWRFHQAALKEWLTGAKLSPQITEVHIKET